MCGVKFVPLQHFFLHPIYYPRTTLELPCKVIWVGHRVPPAGVPIGQVGQVLGEYSLSLPS